MRFLGQVLIVSSVLIGPAADRAMTTAQDVQSAAGARASTQSYSFPSGAGMLFFYVKPDRTADFEAVVTRLSETLDRAEDPVRKQQAANWHILRSVEAT